MTAFPIHVAGSFESPRHAPAAIANIMSIARRELRDAVRSRWFILYTIAFAGLGLAVSFVSAASTGGTGLAGFGRTTAGLINLVLLVVPLMALTAGAGSIASDRERGHSSLHAGQPFAPDGPPGTSRPRGRSRGGRAVSATRLTPRAAHRSIVRR